MANSVELTAAQEIILNRDFITLPNHVLAQCGNFSAEAHDLSVLMSRVALAGKMIARRLSQAGLVADTLGVTGEMNVQGEEVKKMDLYANRIFIRAFENSGLVCRLASEEMENPYYIPENCPIGRYTLL
jgi:fructose-1,6-bisphosphatase I